MIFSPELLFIGVLFLGTFIIVAIGVSVSSVQMKYKKYAVEHGGKVINKCPSSNIVPERSILYSILRRNETIDVVSSFKIKSGVGYVFLLAIDLGRWYTFSTVLIFENENFKDSNIVFSKKSGYQFGYEYESLAKRGANVRSESATNFREVNSFVGYLFDNYRNVRVDFYAGRVVVLFKGGLLKNVLSLAKVEDVIRAYNEFVSAGLDSRISTKK